MSAHESRLRESGLRITAGRLAVLDVLQKQPHADADSVRRALEGSPSRLTLQAVHNVLGDLTEAGVVRRIEPARSAARYEVRVDDNHHHIVCTSCGAIADVDCTVGHAPCLAPSNAHGFAVATAEVTFWGLCGECSAQAAAQHPPVSDHTTPREGVTS